MTLFFHVVSKSSVVSAVSDEAIFNIVSKSSVVSDEIMFHIASKSSVVSAVKKG